MAKQESMSVVNNGIKIGWKLLSWILSPWGLTIVGGSAVVFFIFYIILTVSLLFTSSGGFGRPTDNITDGILNEQTLAWEEDVQREVSEQGLDDKWVRYILGIIQAESGGDANRMPDIMQASESLGEDRNTIDDPIDSIQAGVTALSHAITRAEELDITDTKAILQAYNFNTGYLQAMADAGESEFDINFAQEYSLNVVYPAVSGNPPHTAMQVDYINPWSQQVEMPWRWYNGGNFHYPNIIYYYISFRGDGTFQLPFDVGSFTVTSEYGPRRHPVTGELGRMHLGIDLSASSIAGTPIRSIAAGEVVQVANDVNGWGNYIVIDHGIVGENSFGVEENKKIYSLYAHMSALPEHSIGDGVEQGDIIGFEGTTGSSTGVHLHLEIIIGEDGGSWSGSPRINPRDVLNFD